MNFKSSYFKFAQNRFMSHKIKAKNHYNSLGIPSNSTQSEVKSAYYKLSMVYHPDKNQNNPESSQKFRDITEAYKILGNVNTRKLYDKGLYFKDTIVIDPTLDKFHQSRETRSRPPPPSGRTPIYDFDEWSKNHYGDTFRRTMETKKKREVYRMRREQEVNDAKMEKFLFLSGIAFIVCMCLFRNNINNYDAPFTFGGKPAYKKIGKNDEKD